eukprot:1590917-Rhodomonas_salina.2
MEGEKAAEEEMQAHEDRGLDWAEQGEKGDEEEDGGGGGGGDDEEEEFMFPGQSTSSLRGVSGGMRGEMSSNVFPAAVALVDVVEVVDVVDVCDVGDVVYVFVGVLVVVVIVAGPRVPYRCTDSVQCS